MRKCEADYLSIEAALHSHQQRTLMEYAAIRGVAHWREDTVGCVVATALAVDNMLSTTIVCNGNERSVLMRIAVDFDVDLGTLRRQRRRTRQRTGRRDSPE